MKMRLPGGLMGERKEEERRRKKNERSFLKKVKKETKSLTDRT